MAIDAVAYELLVKHSFADPWQSREISGQRAVS